MPNFRHGRGTRVFVDEEDLSQYFKEANFAHAADTAETSHFGTLDKEFVTGMLGATASLSGMFDGSADAVDEELSGVLGGATASIFTYCPEGAAELRAVRLMQLRETSYNVSGSSSDIVAVSAEFLATGAARRGLSFHNADTAEVANGNSASNDGVAATTKGGAAHLHVFANTRNGALVAKIQHSVDNSAWTDLITFTSVAGALKTQERIELGPTATVNRYVRGLWTVAGSTGSVSFALAFARNLV